MVIDIQNDYFPGGAMALHHVQRASEQARIAMEYARSQNYPCIIVQHIAQDSDATFFRPNTNGVAIHPDFTPKHGDIHVVKHHPNALRDTDLAHHLHQLQAEELIIVGMMTHMCVDTTTRAAADSGYHVTLLSDATATRALTFAGQEVSADSVQIAYLAALQGSFADVVTTHQWLSTRHD